MASRFGGKGPAADPTKVPAGVDSSTYFSPTIPDEVRASVPLFHQSSQEVLRGALKLAVKCFSSSIGDAEFIEYQSALKQQGESFGAIFTGLYSIIRIAIATKTPAQQVNANLVAMNVPEAVAQDISRAIHAARPVLETQALISRPGFSRLNKLRWRVDVTISSGSLARVMRPSILMQLILSDGRIKTFEISIDQFNQLRYSVAKVLFDIRTLERHPIMKIVREFERKDDEKNK